MIAKVMSPLGLRHVHVQGRRSSLFRFLFVLFVVVMFASAAYMYARVQDPFSVCRLGAGWGCAVGGLAVSSSEGSSASSDESANPEDDDPSSTQKQKPTAVPVVATPEPTGSKSWMSSIAEVYSAISDSTKQPDKDWDYASMANNTGMSRNQCKTAFPDLFWEVERAQGKYEKSRITERLLSSAPISDGRVRASILDGKLYISKSNLSAEYRPKAMAVLQSLDHAIQNSNMDPMPNIEFVFSVQRQVPEIKEPVWVFDRRQDDQKVWLMPTPGFVWDGTETSTSGGLGEKEPTTADNKKTAWKFDASATEVGALGVSRDQLVAEVRAIEAWTPFDNKPKRLVGVWRSDDKPQNVRQRALAWAAQGQEWLGPKDTKGSWNQKELGLQGIDSARGSVFSSSSLLPSPTSKVSLAEMCRFSFLAHDTTYNIPVSDGPLLCQSVLLTTKPKWISVYHGLMLANDDHFHLGEATHPVVESWRTKGAGKQNVVLVSDDFGDLVFKMEGLLQYPETARQIAENMAATFRDRYLTNAATACYWREMVRSYAAVSYKPVAGKAGAVGPRGLAGRLSESGASPRGMAWESFRLLEERAMTDFDAEARS